MCMCMHVHVHACAPTTNDNREMQILHRLQQSQVILIAANDCQDYTALWIVQSDLLRLQLRNWLASAGHGRPPNNVATTTKFNLKSNCSMFSSELLDQHRPPTLYHDIYGDHTARKCMLPLSYAEQISHNTLGVLIQPSEACTHVM